MCAHRRLSLLALLLATGPALAGPRDATREALKRALDERVKAAAFEGARVGLHVVSLLDGAVVYSHNPDELLNPASNVKLFTAAAALARLGPEFRWTTEIYTQGPLKGGVCRGHLYVKGKGDPSVVTERLYKLAGDLWHEGLRRVQGDLVIDDTYFDEIRLGPGWEQEKSDRAYMAPVGAVSLNYNAVAIYVRPGEAPGMKATVEVEPQSAYFQVDNQVTTAGPRALRRIIPASIAAGDRQRIVVKGRLPAGRDGMVFYRKIDNPPVYFGETLKKLLAARGIVVTGKVRRAVVPSDAILLTTFDSAPLAEVLRDLNKYSSNFVAETLVKTLGAEIKGTPGSWERGISAIEDFLAEAGIPRGSYVLKNGSGLNDTNRFSARQIVQILAEVHRRFPIAAEFESSLGIAARDGTVRARLEGTEAAGRARVKTGTLENVTALGGYLPGKDGELLAFSLMVNDFPGRAGPVVAAVDSTVAAMAGVVAAGLPRPGELTAGKSAEPADLKARVATYMGLGKLSDRRNLPFLRTSLRGEKDPLVRAVVAEALYLSDPDDGGGARAVLDAFQPAAELLPALRALGNDLSLPTPVVPSVLAIAGEGNVEAIGRVIEVAAAAQGDEGLVDLLAQGLAEVGVNAPEELAEALAAAENAGPALALLARGVPRNDRARHPAFAALKRAAEAEGDGAAAARAAWERLQAEILALDHPEPASKPSAPAASGPTPPPESRPGGG